MEGRYFAPRDRAGPKKPRRCVEKASTVGWTAGLARSNGPEAVGFGWSARACVPTPGAALVIACFALGPTWKQPLTSIATRGSRRCGPPRRTHPLPLFVISPPNPRRTAATPRTLPGQSTALPDTKRLPGLIHAESRDASKNLRWRAILAWGERPVAAPRRESSRTSSYARSHVTPHQSSAGLVRAGRRVSLSDRSAPGMRRPAFASPCPHE